ncbi:MAG TPA: hypothetical protein DCE42_29220 [Myxococcales bacterium]|nr:hypothetical protein [Deltaproteobacteria bacterium]MBU53475.1 hypothetical protein [Deltaproteobacteria bacterium]HAA58880.1 hypothetical protein [Myxococcales bacterium]|tara:strand:- start:4419 stop:4655 length:237 start_codon:yes stop_codon:yes gene_type:complete
MIPENKVPVCFVVDASGKFYVQMPDDSEESFCLHDGMKAHTGAEVGSWSVADTKNVPKPTLDMLNKVLEEFGWEVSFL